MDVATVGEAAVEGIVDNLNEFNMSSIAWNNATLLVPTNTTGCLRPGAMPIPMYNFNCGCSQMFHTLGIVLLRTLRRFVTDQANINRHVATNAQYCDIRAEQLCAEQHQRMSSGISLSELECDEPSSILSTDRGVLAHPVDQRNLPTSRCL